MKRRQNNKDIRKNEFRAKIIQCLLKFKKYNEEGNEYFNSSTKL